MEFQLSEEQQMVQDLARQCAESYVAPQIGFMEEEKRLPDGLFRQLGGADLLGVSFPEAWGGTALGYESYFLVLEELAKVSPSVACSVSTSIGVLEAIERSGTGSQKERYLAPGLRGEFITSMAFTEADTGSDPKQLTTTAASDGDHYILNGTKRFITNASYPGPILLFAKDETGRCTAFLFDKFCEGYSLSTPWEKTGFDGSPVYDVYLDNVRVHRDCILGEQGKGFELLLMASAHGKLGHAAICLGLISTCRDMAVKYAREKTHRGEPIFKFQSIQLKIAQLTAKCESARWYAYRCADTANSITDPARFQAEAALLKSFVADLAPECALLAMSVLGAYSVTKEYNLERYMRDALVEPIIEVASDVQRIIYGTYLYRSKA